MKRLLHICKVEDSIVSDITIDNIEDLRNEINKIGNIENEIDRIKYKQKHINWKKHNKYMPKRRSR